MLRADGLGLRSTDVKDKTVFITGAAQGLGEAYAVHLASKGAHVVIADINEPGARRVADDINAGGGRALALGVDVTQEAAVSAAFAAAVAEFGKIDVLVNNAGAVFSWLPTEETSLEDWNKTLALCLTGTWLCARAAIPVMKQAGNGRIINVASGTIDRGIPTNMSAYIAAKGGVVTFTRALARELGPHGITVNAISPGLYVMDKGDEMIPIAELIEKDQTIPRPGVPDDIVGAVAFLASDAASFITGQVLNVDGGYAFK